MHPFSSVLCVDDKLINFVKNSYEKTDENIEEDVKILRDWCQKQEHFPQNFNDEWLTRILMRNKFRIEQSKKKLEAYFTLRGINKDAFFNVEDFHPKTDNFKNVLKTSFLFTSSKATKDGARTFFFRFNGTDTEFFNFRNLLKLFYIFGEIVLQYDFAMTDRLVCELSDFKFAHFLKMDPIDLAKCFTIWQECFSSRLIGVEFLHSPSFIAMVTKIIEPVLKHGKITIHHNVESLLKVVSKENLPEEFGGTEGKIQDLQDAWVAQIEKNWDWIVFRSEQISNESKRIGKSHYTDVFGVDGTFKKINID